ncbi:MAG: hypothetical protein LKH27_08170 [Prevotella sp.]|jgi:hypothetical protein|nr:hypothetical protein [Prevotella sp.]MCH3993026.1 hypothetical protein [Prevotella sp.]MCI1474373.1 hypothetical protein [Prevotella sp.]MCI1596071.1 hypothetical protein [Prevotella sp.]
MSFNDSNNPDKLDDYGELGYIDEYRKRIDERNSHKLRKAQYQEIADLKKDRRKNQIKSNCSLIISIISLIIAILSLIIAYETLRATK